MSNYNDIINACAGASHIIIVSNGYVGNFKPESPFGKVFTHLMTAMSGPILDIIVSGQWQGVEMERALSVALACPLTIDDEVRYLPSYILVFHADSWKCFFFSRALSSDGDELYPEVARKLGEYYAPRCRKELVDA